MGLPGHLGDHKADGAVDGDEDPQLPGVPAAVPLDHQHGAEKAEDGSGGADDAGEGLARDIGRRQEQDSLDPPMADKR